MKEVQLSTWTEFKKICIIKKDLKVQCVETADTYNLFALDGPSLCWWVNLVKDTPDSSDFKKNHLKDCNKPL
jgi:hypothetical protein